MRSRMKNDLFSNHAKEQLSKRKISEDLVWKILSENSVLAEEDGLTVYQAELIENKRVYLVRIFVNESKNPNVIVTVYKTSKIKKYL